MDFEVRHFIPGRVRVFIPLLRHESPFSTSMASWVEGLSGVKSVRINYACASIVIEFDRKRPEVWAQMLFYLEYVTLDALREIVMRPRAEVKKPGKAIQVVTASRKWPLAWPTVSLALAFVVNPWALFVSVPLLLWNSL